MKILRYLFRSIGLVIQLFGEIAFKFKVLYLKIQLFISSTYKYHKNYDSEDIPIVNDTDDGIPTVTSNGYKRAKNTKIKDPILNFLRSKPSLKALLSIDIIKNNTQEKNAKRSILEVLMINRTGKDYIAYAYILFTLIASIAITMFYSVSPLIILIPLLLAFLIAIYHRLIAYRLKKGWLGNNYYEALEIIQFIDEQDNNSNFFDNGNLKKIFPEISIESQHLPKNEEVGVKT